VYKSHIMHHQGRKATASQCPGVQDPLAPAAQLPPTAASEIVKAARWAEPALTETGFIVQ
jgi:hypothetical protein